MLVGTFESAREPRMRRRICDAAAWAIGRTVVHEFIFKKKKEKTQRQILSRKQMNERRERREETRFCSAFFVHFEITEFYENEKQRSVQIGSSID